MDNSPVQTFLVHLSKIESSLYHVNFDYELGYFVE